ncbi:NAD-dependent succinate-semialdehyde dehydrogenase [Salinimonas iocasae]|uniref:NAD-dependent succinate-semialdehyde dehydrogenase n=1 Tax=Salinimonas iocasae TaxID=2572577 RepID=A0A5B7YHK2_9ALTE|nr:NAD-dependent succinate-semialdehyde dehydrogenase [Salinimonas iocasae]QCZ94995.1 NAD-dependent succinate-semialdehyde dehydrogenase [Salinimonas iocasae]
MSNTVETINPATEQTLKSYTLLSTDDAKKAVDASHEAFTSWRKTSLAERSKLFNALADKIDERADEIVELMIEEMGKVKAQGYQEVELCAGICRYTAENAESQLADEKREYEGGNAIISYQPIGVILGIQPWNFPLYQVIRYSVPNIMAGNTTVLKHADNVFGMAEMIQDLYEQAGFPKNVYQSLLISGETASELIQHDKVRGVTFTGSDKVGKKVGENAGSQSKKSVLELGSNDAFIVLEDADIETAVEACVQGRVINNGETCVSAKRFIITDKIYDKFRDAYVQQFKNLKVGDPRAEDTDVGPMARKDLRDKLNDQVQESIKKGATCTLGGDMNSDTGYYYPLTILEDVKPGMPAYDDELFGPVASFIRAKDDGDAMRIANDSRYGLGGGIFSSDQERAIELARTEFDTGMVNINGYSLAQPNLPFGGVKESGYGREHGGFGIKEFVNIKTIFIADQ